MRGCPRWPPAPSAIDRPQRLRRRRVMMRLIVVLLLLAFTSGVVVEYMDSPKVAHASDAVSELTRERDSARAVQIARRQGGEFALRAKINGIPAPMVVDTGATSVVL